MPILESINYKLQTWCKKLDEKTTGRDLCYSPFQRCNANIREGSTLLIVALPSNFIPTNNSDMDATISHSVLLVIDQIADCYMRVPLNR